MSIDEQKKAVGVAAAALIEDGMTVGLGTGSTAVFFVQALAARKLTLTCVSTSEATAALARSLGMTMIDIDDAGPIDLTVDGADEIGPGLDVIKGGGAALLREKIVWEASLRRIAIADVSKRSTQLGRFPLPIEVIAFGHLSTAARVERALRDCGIQTAPMLRVKNGSPVTTDSGNYIYDAACGAIPNAPALSAALKLTTGVVEHGLFLGLAAQALIATDQGVLTLNL